MQELKWNLCPLTPVSWLNVYMQVAYLKETEELLLPRYPRDTFTQIAQVPAPSTPSPLALTSESPFWLAELGTLAWVQVLQIH